jgi:hypothetical protein
MTIKKIQLGGGGGSFDGTMDDIPNGTTYVKTENNLTDTEKTKLSNLSGTNSGDNAVNSLYSGLAASKQDALVSGTNIKTINGSSILGSGNLTISAPPEPSTTTILTLAGNQSTGANQTPITLTDMSFSYEANSVYTIDLLAFVQSSAATTGIGFIIDVSTAITKMGLSFFHQLATTGTLSGGSLIADDALIGVSSGLPNTTENFVQGKGVLITGANTGTAQFKFRSEVNAVTTINANSKFIINKIS